MHLLLLLFIVMPVLEMWVLIEVGGIIGAGPTIGLVLLTAAVGYGLLRQQGFATLLRGRQRLERGELPASEILEGVVLAVSGALLLTPGFVTDSLGFLGLLSPLRTAIAKRLLARAVAAEGVGGGAGIFRAHSGEETLRSRPSSPPSGAGSRPGHTYEGEFEEDRD